MEETVPQWVVEKLGKVVTVREPFRDGVRIWPARSAALLTAIYSGELGPRVGLILLGDETQAEETFRIDEIAP